MAAPAVVPPTRDEKVASLVRFVNESFSWLPLTLLIAASPGIFVFQLIGATPAYALDNELDTRARLLGLGAVAISALFVLAIYLLRVRARADEASTAQTARSLNGWLAPLLILPCVPPLLAPKIEVTSPWLTILLCAIPAVVAVHFTYVVRREPKPTATSPLPAIVTAVLAIGYTIVLSYLAIRQHHGLRTEIMDLAVYDNLFYHSSHGRFLATGYVKGGSHISAHFDPLLVLLSPLYLLYPRAEFLLVFQSLWIASSVIPLFLLSKLKLESRWLATAICAAFLLSPAVMGTNLYDFHSLTLITPLIIWAIWALESRSYKAFVAVAVLLVLTREDIPLLLCFVAGWALLSGKSWKVALGTIGAAIFYFILVKGFVQGSGVLNEGSKNAHSYAYYYSDLIQKGEGAGGLVLSLVTNPIFVIKHVLSEGKVLYLLKIFTPLLFLPFFARRGRLMLVYGLALCLLASKGAMYSLHFQYSATFVPIALALVPLALASLPESRTVTFFRLDPARLRPALVAGVLVASLGISAKYGALVPNDAFRAGFSRMIWKFTDEMAERYAWLEQAIAQIPGDASVSSTRTFGPHISNRKEAFPFPWGKNSDFLLLETRQLDAKSKRFYDAIVKTHAYVELSRHETMVLLRRDTAVALPRRGF